MRNSFIWSGTALALAALAAPVFAQVQPIDPNTAIDADLGPAPQGQPAAPASSGETVYYGDTAAPPPPASTPPSDAPAAPVAPADTAQTYKKDDLIGAAEGVFGKGAKGVAQLIEKILKDQGEPTPISPGARQAARSSSALRYGSGTLYPQGRGADARSTGRARRSASMSAPTPAAPSCSSTTFTTARSCTSASRRRGQRLFRRRVDRELYAPRRHRADPGPPRRRAAAGRQCRLYEVHRAQRRWLPF